MPLGAGAVDSGAVRARRREKETEGQRKGPVRKRSLERECVANRAAAGVYPRASVYLLDVDLAPGLALADGGDGQLRQLYGAGRGIGLANQPDHGAGRQ